MKPFCIVIFVLVATFQGIAQERLPIIDMHMHALAADQQGPPSGWFPELLGLIF